MILLYSSHNLRHWTFLHPLIEGSPGKTQSINPVDNGEMWECPDFFPFGNKHVLLLATMGKVHWKVGTYANQHFTAEKEGVVDWARITRRNRCSTRMGIAFCGDGFLKLAPTPT